ncbi:MAG: 4-hydroxy-tetrahydrodipicolinate synthase, partial [Solirubrobacteraceae bacterium]|nr:4-hydroxy-tetrahydrodipicolinate synthase [Solirubrobacteraceae bacterium]
MPNLGAILTAIVTPFDASLRVDEEAFVAIGRHLLDHGSDGLVVCGTTGEAPTLSDEEQRRLIELAVNEFGDTATIVAGAGSNDTRHAVHLTEQATEVGAHAILSVTGYYNRPNRRGIVRHYEEVARATEVPVLVYNIPSRTTVDLSNDLLAELAQIEHVDGVKQARATDLALIDGLDLYAGNDDMLADVLDLGGAGGICVASHIVGDEMDRMVEEPGARREIHAKLADVFSTLFITASPIPLKAALNMLGLPAGRLRLPLVEASDEEVAQVRTM